MYRNVTSCRDRVVEPVVFQPGQELGGELVEEVLTEPTPRLMVHLFYQELAEIHFLQMYLRVLLIQESVLKKQSTKT